MRDQAAERMVAFMYEGEPQGPDLRLVEPGYEAWKQAKIERGLAQTRDRETMIPIKRIWRELSLKR